MPRGVDRLTADRTPRPTIKDIAALAGVTPGTVSRVVNGRPGVGDAARARIEKLIAQYGYRTNVSARQLSTGRSHTVAVVFPLHASELVMHPVYPELLGAVGDAAEDADYDILLLSVTSPARMGRVMDTVTSGRIGGVLLPAAGSRDPVLREMLRLGIPVVTIGHRPTQRDSWWVDSTHDDAAAELTRRLVAVGRKRVLLLNGPSHVSACRLRSRGFWTAARESGLPADHVRELSVAFDTLQARDAALAELTSKNRPDAIVCGSDLIASAVLDVARQLSLAVPVDLAVTGFDDQPLAVHTMPTLTTVRMPLRDVGTTAAGLLFDRLNGTPVAQPRRVFPTEIVVRESTPPDF
jgi:LacI family transcriptional regulator, galactose operon repressor